MKLLIDNEAKQIGIYNPVACIIDNIIIKNSSPELDGEINWLTNHLRNASKSILSQPEVKGFNNLFTNLGYPEQTPAGQRLIELILKRGINRYNNIIDSYNIVSALYGSGIGMHDFKDIDDDIYVRRALGHEKILPLFKNKNKKIPAGDLVYSTKDEIIAWIGKNDIDSDNFKIKNETHDILLVILGNKETSESYNLKILKKIISLISLSCSNIHLKILENIFI